MSPDISLCLPRSPYISLDRDIGWVRSGSRICYYQNLTRVLTTYYLLLTTDQVRSGSRICYYQNLTRVLTPYSLLLTTYYLLLTRCAAAAASATIRTSTPPKRRPRSDATR